MFTSTGLSPEEYGKQFEHLRVSTPPMRLWRVQFDDSPVQFDENGNLVVPKDTIFPEIETGHVSRIIYRDNSEGSSKDSVGADQQRETKSTGSGNTGEPFDLMGPWIGLFKDYNAALRYAVDEGANHWNTDLYKIDPSNLDNHALIFHHETFRKKLRVSKDRFGADFVVLLLIPKACIRHNLNVTESLGVRKAEPQAEGKK